MFNGKNIIFHGEIPFFQRLPTASHGFPRGLHGRAGHQAQGADAAAEAQRAAASVGMSGERHAPGISEIFHNKDVITI